MPKPGAAAHIIIRPEMWGDRTDVVLEPALPGESADRDFASIDDARAYAAALSEKTGRPIVDQTDLPGLIGGAA